MKSHMSCWSLLLFLGFSQPVVIKIPQSSVNGTVGLPVLLPVLYSLQRPFRIPLTIKWQFGNSPNPLISYTMTNCSVSAEGIPIHWSGDIFTRSPYQGRTVYFPENASLLLQDLQLSDSGVYSVAFESLQQTRNITLTVSAMHFNHGDVDGGSETKNPSPLLLGLSITGGFSFLLLLLLMLFCCRQRKGAGQQKRLKIIKQQEVTNLEEFHMDSSLPRNLSTIYAKIGEDLGRKQPRLEPQIEYASLRFS